MRFAEINLCVDSIAVVLIWYICHNERLFLSDLGFCCVKERLFLTGSGVLP